MTARVLFFVRTMAGGRGGHNAQKSELSAQRRGPICPDVAAIKLSPAFNDLNASKLGKKDVRVTVEGLSRG